MSSNVSRNSRSLEQTLPNRVGVPKAYPSAHRRSSRVATGMSAVASRWARHCGLASMTWSGPALPPGTGAPRRLRRRHRPRTPARGRRGSAGHVRGRGVPEVVYEMAASGSRNTGSVSYTDEDREIIRRNGITLPWRITFPVGAQRKPLVPRRPGRRGTCRFLSVTRGSGVRNRPGSPPRACRRPQSGECSTVPRR